MKALRDEKGIALILVLLMISVIVALTLELNASTRSDIYEAANFRDRIRAAYMAKSGFNAATALLMNNANNYNTLTEVWANTAILTPYSAQLLEGLGECQVNIQDESGKIPVQMLVSNNKYNETYRQLLVRFLQLPEFQLNEDTVEGIVDSIKDWIDTDEEVTGQGAESSYYAQLKPPYQAKNGPLDSIDELLLVKGITREIFFGSEGRPGIRDYLTICGEGKININTAPLLVLRALSPDMTVEKAQAMDTFRRNEANNSKLAVIDWYKSLDLLTGAGIDNSLIDVKSSYFQITSTGILAGTPMSETVSGIVKKDSGKITILSWKTGL